MKNIKKGKYHWIKEDIELDFPLPREVSLMIEDLEKLDLAEDYAYFNFSESLDYIARDCYNEGKITKKQWDLINLKYEGD